MYNIIVKSALKTKKRGQIVDSADKLTEARKKVAEWETYLLANTCDEWEVSYRIVRE